MSNAVIGEAVYLELDVDFVRTFFQPINVIDNGMCGEVILAKPLEDLTRKCVVKKFSLLTETEDRSERNERIFKNEVKFMQGLRHPYIATSMLAVKCPGYLALSMDYYEGRTLNHHVDSISIEMAELSVIQVACALRYMHRNNLAHLDVKLENIFVDGEFNSILGDFGLSVVLSPEQQTLPRYKCGGTPCYFAPERRDDNHLTRNLTHTNKTCFKTANLQMDSYCLGVVLWCLVFKRSPHVDTYYYLEARRRQDLQPLIKDTLLRLLDQDPTRRVTVAAFLDWVRDETIHRHIIREN